MRNIHSREIDAPATAVGALLDTLAGPYDRLWPTPAWWPLRLDKPLAVGASGGHGPVRYAVTEYEPGRRVRFEFTPEDGLYGGFHELRVTPAGAQRCVLTHEIAGALTGAELVTWPLLARPLHDALVEDLLDTAERAVTGTVRQPSGHSRWVRILRRLMADRARPGPLPEGAELARESFVRYDYADSYSVPLRPGMPVDAGGWVDAIFRGRPFPVLRRTSSEVLIGGAAPGLRFRASVLVADERLTLSTIVRWGRLGRWYFALVRPFHRAYVRSLLTGAVHRATTTSAGRGTAMLASR